MMAQMMMMIFFWFFWMNSSVRVMTLPISVFFSSNCFSIMCYFFMFLFREIRNAKVQIFYELKKES